MADIDFKYSHAAILVSDMERSIQWYERAVGWTPVIRAEFTDGTLGIANGYGGNGRIVLGNMGGVHLQLVKMEVELERKQLPMHYGIFMCSVMVKDLEPVRERLKAADIAITRELEIGKSHLLVLTDPDGQEIGIICPREGA